ncbi:hypothetical protein RCC89_13010 [Cytophagaceae bacterium ABcell3]|nr:hypothetical protein RCC89_13010 [Cytophagaceae bacterium ABcell3]
MTKCLGYSKSVSIGLLLFFVSLALPFGAKAQNRDSFAKRYINSLINDTTDISKPKFIAYPTLAYAPETSWEFGFSGLYVYFANRDTTNRLSEINGFSFITLENQYGFWFDHALYTHENKWFFLGRIRLQDFPLRYYGIGPYTTPSHTAVIEATQVNIRERVLRKVYKDLFVGLQGDWQQLRFARFTSIDQEEFEFPLGGEGSLNIGLGLNVVYDTRHNVLNVRDGLFSELAFLRYPGLASNYNFSTLISDNRIYRPVGKNNVLAAQVMGQFNFGNTPFNMLSLMGGENLMRGYYLGRFRDNNQIATQVEFRFLPLPLNFTNRIGAALFASTASVFDEFENFSVSKFVFAGGGGLRFLLFPKRDIYTRFDVAFTNEGSGFYLFIGEAF